MQLFFKNPKDFSHQYDFFPKSNVIKLENIVRIQWEGAFLSAPCRPGARHSNNIKL